MKNLSYAVLSLCFLTGLASQAFAETKTVELDPRITVTANFIESSSFEKNEVMVQVQSPRVTILNGDPTGYDLSVYSDQKKLCKTFGFSEFVSATAKPKAERYAAIIDSQLSVKMNLRGVFHGTRPSAELPRKFSYSFAQEGEAFETLTCRKELQATSIMTGQIRN